MINLYHFLLSEKQKKKYMENLGFQSHCYRCIEIKCLTVSGVIIKRKCLRTTATRAQSGRPSKVVQCHQILKHTEPKGSQSSADSTAEVQTSSGIN